MILLDNLMILREKFPEIMKLMKENEEKLKDYPASVIPSKVGVPTFSVDVDGNSYYFHSKYDPISEAEQLINHYAEEIEKYNHVFFYGVGFGYHIEAFIQRYPEKQYTLYEPSLHLFYQYLCNSHLKSIATKQLKRLFIEANPQSATNVINSVVGSLKDEVLFIGLPSYERFFPERLSHFIKTFKDSASNKKYSLHTNMFFKTRWTLNSMINITETVRTPNILHDLKPFFQDKPVIIVAAGPSLADEVDNLRYIKDNHLAYIMSVGSSLEALLNYDIEPDIACTYDPTELNHTVFNPLIERNITSIPLFYGSSVGFETLLRYPGKKYHMLTNQDTISPFYLKKEGIVELDKVSDAATISAIVLQLVYKLGCKLVIMVGQNLAYRDNQNYSAGIKDIRGRSATQVTDEEMVSAITVEDVYGNQIPTTSGYNSMRMQIEAIIKTNSATQTINTTKGGARIDGAVFTPMEDLIRDTLTTSIDTTSWLSEAGTTGYDCTYLASQMDNMDAELKEFLELYERLLRKMRKIKALADTRKLHDLTKQFPSFDRIFKQILKNDFFKVFFMPLHRVEVEYLGKCTAEIKATTDIVRKSEMLIEEFGKFFYGCQKTLEQSVGPIYHEMHRILKARIQELKNGTATAVNAAENEMDVIHSIVVNE